MSQQNFYEKIGRPTKIVAPMVEHSGLAYRMLCRRYGADLVYTQMFSARSFVESAEYRKTNFQTCPEDRPLIVQLCGHDPDMLLRAAKLVENDCDAVDINLGCPQGIAKRGRYGAFLMEELDLLTDIVSTLSKGLKIPVTCKTRIYHDFDRSVRLLETLANAGASLLTVHGRTREEKKQQIRACDWSMLKRIKKHFAESDTPIIANGGIATINDVHRCLQSTGCDGVMVSEAILEDPAIFSRPVVDLPALPPLSRGTDGGERIFPGGDDHIDDPLLIPDDRLSGHWYGSPTQLELAREYLELCRQYPPRYPKTMRGHLMKFLFRYFVSFPEIRNRLGESNSVEEFEALCEELSALVGDDDARFAQHDWYHRHRAALAAAEADTSSAPTTSQSSFLQDLGEGGGDGAGEDDCEECGGVFSGMGMFDE